MYAEEDYCWVYVIGPGPVKIGISCDPNVRLGIFQTACPFAIDLEYVFEFTSRREAFAVERAFHCANMAHHAHGEWFNLSPRAAIARLCPIIRSLELEPQRLDPCGVLFAEKRLAGVSGRPFRG